MRQKIQSKLEQTQAAIVKRYGHIMPMKYRHKFEQQINNSDTEVTI